MNPPVENNNEEGIAAKKAKTKIGKKRENAKYNPDELPTDAKATTSGKRFKSAPKPLVGYITGREQHDAMVKYLQQKPIISIDSYNLRMSNIYDQIGKSLSDKSTEVDINKINNFNSYMRKVDVELVYEEDK